MGQHCTGQNSVQCCPRGSRQLCIRKILCNVALILLEQHYTDQNLMQCCPRCSRQHCIRKILCNVALILLGQHYIGKTLCNVSPEAPNDIAQEKIQAISSEQYLVTLFCLHIYVSGPSSQKKYKVTLPLLRKLGN